MTVAVVRNSSGESAFQFSALTASRILILELKSLSYIPSGM